MAFCALRRGLLLIENDEQWAVLLGRQELKGTTNGEKNLLKILEKSPNFSASFFLNNCQRK
jgi:hypothetical protein